jgi:hypothetical protein
VASKSIDETLYLVRPGDHPSASAEARINRRFDLNTRLSACSMLDPVWASAREVVVTG